MSYPPILNDISTEQDIRTLVNSFYDRVNRDEILGRKFAALAHRAEIVPNPFPNATYFQAGKA